MIAGQAAIQGTHHGHGAHAEEQGAGDKTLRDAGFSVFRELCFQLVTQVVDTLIQPQQLAKDAAQYNGDDGNQHIGAADHTVHTDADNAQGYAFHHGIAELLGKLFAQDHADDRADNDHNCIYDSSG